MKITKCANGHYFDLEKFKECPVCKAGNDILIKNEERTQALFYTDKRPVKDQIRTEGYFERSDKDGRTIGVYRTQKENPIAAWIVCRNGSSRGKFFAIYTGKNSIGKSRSMDIVIAGKDVCEENHACIVYDYRNIEFYITGINGKIQLNQQDIIGWNKLHSNDSFIIGDLVFDFIPYCNKERNWNENKKKNI